VNWNDTFSCYESTTTVVIGKPSTGTIDVISSATEEVVGPRSGQRLRPRRQRRWGSSWSSEPEQRAVAGSFRRQKHACRGGRDHSRSRHSVGRQKVQAEFPITTIALNGVFGTTRGRTRHSLIIKEPIGVVGITLELPASPDVARWHPRSRRVAQCWKPASWRR
jgi:hypothetical protein